MAKTELARSNLNCGNSGLPEIVDELLQQIAQSLDRDDLKEGPFQVKAYIKIAHVFEKDDEGDRIATDRVSVEAGGTAAIPPIVKTFEKVEYNKNGPIVTTRQTSLPFDAPANARTIHK